MDPATPPQNNPAGQNPTQGTPATGAPAAANPAAATPASVTPGQFNVPAAVMEKYPQLVELIKKTESMSNEEREYWFQILPIMTEEQVTRLKTILDQEAAQLSKLDDQYQDELSKLNKKHLEEWNVFEKKQQRVALQEKEAHTEAEEKKAEEEILKQLDTPANPPTPPVQP